MDLSQLKPKGYFQVTMILLILTGVFILRKIYTPIGAVHPKILIERNTNNKNPQAKTCDDIMRVNITELPKYYLDIKASLDKEIQKYGGIRTGHVGMVLKKELALLSAVKTKSFRTICETGFNGGHSALIWLYADKNTKVYSFDLGSFKYSIPASVFLQHTFPGRLNLSWGDSKRTLPKFTKSNPRLKCDLIFIDGSHRYPEVTLDLHNFHKHANDNFSLLIADDIDAAGVNRAWNEQIKDGKITEYCMVKGYFMPSNRHKGHNFTVSFGTYVGLS